MILLVDNYDSFSYNLYQLIGTVEPALRVVRNDALTVEEALALHPAGIVLSPGPGRPEDAGICMDLAKAAGETPLLGVCLGHQAICAAYGATVTHARQLMHGKQSVIRRTAPSPLFAGCGEEITVARYHSLAAVADTLPPELQVTALAEDGEVMAVQHTSRPLYGLQFHPESIMTPEGMTMIRNFIELTRRNPQ